MPEVAPFASSTHPANSVPYSDHADPIIGADRIVVSGSAGGVE